MVANVADAVLKLERAKVRFGRKVVLESVSESFESGQLVAVRGANGSGKTTLLRLAANVFRPNDGQRIGPGTCAYVPAAVTPPSLACGVWIDSLPRRRRRVPVRAVLETLGFDGDLRAPCRTLSFGNLRKLLLAEALSSGESLLVIDEASTGMDSQGMAGLAQVTGEARLSGALLLVADQDGRRIAGVTRTLRVSNGSVDEVAESVERMVDITLRGPITGKPQLEQMAAGIGFTTRTKAP